MEFNHERIRWWIKTVGIAVFVGAIVYQVRRIIVHGGKLIEADPDEPTPTPVDAKVETGATTVAAKYPSSYSYEDDSDCDTAHCEEAEG